jgi:hypothetical protein
MGLFLYFRISYHPSQTLETGVHIIHKLECSFIKVIYRCKNKYVKYDVEMNCKKLNIVLIKKQLMFFFYILHHSFRYQKSKSTKRHKV